MSSDPWLVVAEMFECGEERLVRDPFNLANEVKSYIEYLQVVARRGSGYKKYLDTSEMWSCGHHIRRLRRGAHMTQAELAKILGFKSGNSVSYLEKALIPPSKKTKRAIEDLFSLEAGSLSGGCYYGDGDKVRNIRMRQGLSRRELSDIAGIKYLNALSKLENGEHLYNALHMRIWAKALCVPLYDILSRYSMSGEKLD